MSAPAPVPEGAIRGWVQPAWADPVRQTVLLILPCPMCGADVEWIGARVLDSGGATRYTFGKGCSCPSSAIA